MKLTPTASRRTSARFTAGAGRSTSTDSSTSAPPVCRTRIAFIGRGSYTLLMTAFLTVMACDALFIVLAIPLMLRKVRPNVLYGYRTRATLTNETLWYEANAHFGRGFLIGSAASGVAALVLWSIKPAAELV